MQLATATTALPIAQHATAMEMVTISRPANAVVVNLHSLSQTTNFNFTTRLVVTVGVGIKSAPATPTLLI